MTLDFTSTAFQHTLTHGKWRSSQLARAVGIKHGTQYNIVDCTAGFGKDAFILSHLGYSVTCLERHNDMFAQLHTALTHATGQASTAEAATRITLHHADAITWLAHTTTEPDIIYLDPMFPHSNKSAAVKKNMQQARELVGYDEDAADLLKIALEKVIFRVVVKRAASSPLLGEQAPSHQLIGKSNWFDVYIKRAFSHIDPSNPSADAPVG